ncbi:efflux RND transporter periplasmic adaptor subunit [Aquibium oceanicum]|uniref:Efflux transporter periplasmic adaptor subunit n=1 Tax=Aquibium oceanicum TaxID=1670800 RepID=A0A1L3SKQ2_9HYPH|nr:efflux RND transporter periplasmic adaptor subunit [Aquibium oceanicum]APH69976.1 efflux transporter periplasmic adaptor subunit [Aquibium oceanicum]
MAKYRFHKLAAIVVFAASAAWIATGEFSSVGSAVSQSDDQAPEAVAEEPTVAPRVVAVVTPPRVEHARAIRISGTTEADQRTRLAARTGGIIEELAVQKGNRVEKGDLILRLETEGKQAAVEMAEAMLSQRQAELDAAERLAKSGNVAKLQLDSARTGLATAQSQLEAAKAEFDRIEIRAPFSGLVDSVPVEEGSSLQQGAEVATILNLDPILAVGEVGEVSLGYVGVGDKADVRLVDGQRVEGTIRYISRDASAQTRTFRVEVAIPNEDASIPAGMTAEITLRAEPVDSTVLPRSVITLSAAGDLGVRAVDGENKVVFYPIDLVDDTPRGLVLAGIPADARIIVAGQELVAEGDVVEPKEADRATIEKLVGNLADGM